jgi:molecular chaperone DnaK
LGQLKSESGKYNRLWYTLLHKAEDAKIELTARTSAEIELRITDDDDTDMDVSVTVTRSEYEQLIKADIHSTVEMIQKILTRNSLRPEDLAFVLMVGGATYTPFVRRYVEEALGIRVNTDIDPTNAIAIGAAYFAATKEKEACPGTRVKHPLSGAISIKMSYNGAYDSGLKKATPRIAEDVPLRADTYNVFTLSLYDANGNLVPTKVDPIQIAQGKYAVAGQLLPYDLSLVKDDINTHDTKLEPIFLRNTVLPAEKPLTVDVDRTIIHGSDDEIRIIVVEGSSENHHTANLQIGALVIRGSTLGHDVFRGTEIDLTFQVSESRDVTVTAFVHPSGPELREVFEPKKRDVDRVQLTEEIALLSRRVEVDVAEAIANEDYEAAEALEKLRGPVAQLADAALILTIDDVTDDRHKIDARKRKIAGELSRLTAGKRLDGLKDEYKSLKTQAMEIVGQSGNDVERRQLNAIIAREHTFLTSSNPQKVADAIAELHRLSFHILSRTPSFLVGWFEHLVGKREVFNDQVQAKSLIEAGKGHIAGEDFDRLAEVNFRLLSLLPQEVKDTKEMRYFTSIV